MTTFFYYALEANLYLILFAVFYFFILRMENNHLANRAVLLTGLTFSWTLPSIGIVGAISGIMPSFTLSGIAISDSVSQTPQSFTTFSYLDGLSLFYVIGVTVGALLFAHRLRSTFLHVRAPFERSGILKIIEGESTKAWSFFNYVVLGREVCSENKNWIFEHESVHAREGHSVDRLLMHVVKIFGWFNPAVYYLDSALEENHEFRADEVVCQKCLDSVRYSEVLVSQSIGGMPAHLLSLQFSKKSLLKTRIEMIHQTKPTGKIKYLLVIPVMAVAVLLHSCVKDDAVISSPPEKTAAKIFVQGNSDEIYQVVEKMPEFQGGMGALMAFMGENTVYPKSASESDEEGKVFVSFVVDESGNVMNPEIVETKSLQSEALRQAALETVAKMPAWTPGEQGGEKVKVKLTLPIKFQLE